MNTTTNLLILLIVTLVIFPATAIRYAHGQPVPQENNNTGNSTSTGGLQPPPPPPPATTANSPTSPQTCESLSPNNCPSAAEQNLYSELQHRSDLNSDSDRCGDRDQSGGCR